MCPKGYHYSCIPADGMPPATEWFCPECQVKRHHKYGMLAEERKKVLVGPDHQAPYLPDIFFLSSSSSFQPARPPAKLIWSAECGASLSDADIDQYLQECKGLWPLNLFVKANAPLVHRQLRRAIYARRSRFDSSEKSKKSRGDVYTCPFSPDLAMILLSFCGYKTDQALSFLVTREFKKQFRHICFPPREPYRNKWHPQDRRWKLHKTPFPGKSGPLAAPDYLAVAGMARERRYAKLQSVRR